MATKELTRVAAQVAASLNGRSSTPDQQVPGPSPGRHQGVVRTAIRISSIAEQAISLMCLALNERPIPGQISSLGVIADQRHLGNADLQRRSASEDTLMCVIHGKDTWTSRIVRSSALGRSGTFRALTHWMGFEE